MGIASYLTEVSIQTDSDPFTDEAMSLVSGNTFQITDAAKRVWNRAVDVEVKVDGSVVTPSSVNYLFGTVTLASSPGADPVTVTGAYLTVTPITHVASYSLTLSATMLEKTFLSQTSRTRDAGLLDSSVTLSRFEDGEDAFRDALDARASLLVEIVPGGGTKTFRGWYVTESTNLSGGVDDLENDEVTLQLDSEHEDVLRSMAWNVD